MPTICVNCSLVNPPARRARTTAANTAWKSRATAKFLADVIRGDTNPVESILADPVTGSGQTTETSLFGSGTMLEMLLAAFDRTPHRIDHIAEVLRDLKKTPEGIGIVAERFREIWVQLESASQATSTCSQLVSKKQAATEDTTAGGVE